PTGVGADAFANASSALITTSEPAPTILIPTPSQDPNSEAQQAWKQGSGLQTSMSFHRSQAGIRHPLAPIHRVPPRKGKTAHARTAEKIGPYHKQAFPDNPARSSKSKICEFRRAANSSLTKFRRDPGLEISARGKPPIGQVWAVTPGNRNE